MKIPRDLNGKYLVEVLCRHWDYQIVHQQGSHIILDTESPCHQRLSIPNHNPLRLGTLNSILRAVASHKGVSKVDVINTF
ncbi:MAG: type II toxin-antitoxin system HicA family toxin [Phormidium sp. BM_Day4_Bin.17]|nr:type II toxin-antitoxin system HicA family toxin [Phormidium sp. BM_Day4_Bin.17]UCJ11942.1 MAG: type II toxin-antitoxin system HicA family toxin [Phormidium sp. PBR-2020]